MVSVMVRTVLYGTDMCEMISLDFYSPELSMVLGTFRETEMHTS